LRVIANMFCRPAVVLQELHIIYIILWYRFVSETVLCKTGDGCFTTGQGPSSPQRLSSFATFILLLLLRDKCVNHTITVRVIYREFAEILCHVMRSVASFRNPDIADTVERSADILYYNIYICLGAAATGICIYINQ